MLPICARLAIQLARGVEQRRDLGRRLQVASVRRSLPNPPLASSRRVARDEFALDGPFKDRGEQRDRHVDRDRRQRLVLAQLGRDIALDGVERDLIEAQRGEVGQEMCSPAASGSSPASTRRSASQSAPTTPPRTRERSGSAPARVADRRLAVAARCRARHLRVRGAALARPRSL